MLRYDPCPKVRTAGYKPKTGGTTSAHCLNEESGRPPTPDKLKKHINRHKYPLGAGPAIQNPNAHPMATYGRAMPTAAGPGNSTRPLTPGTLEQYIHEKSEEMYASSKRAPIGKPVSYGVTMKDPNMSHGRKSIFSESAKQLLYADPQMKMGSKGVANSGDAALRNITQPRERNYDWSKTAVRGNPQDFRFGKSEVGPHGPTGAQLTQDMIMRDDTKTISKRVIDIRNRRNYPIGRARNAPENIASLPEDFVFGKPGNRDRSQSTKMCIHGFSPEDQMPDKDLGVSRLKLKKGVKKHPEDRVFGVPSLRKDIIAPKIKSVADKNNYGDEFGAQDVLYPEQYAFDAVEEKDFLKIRAADEIRKIFAEIGITVTEEEFLSISAEAEKIFGGLSVDSFRTVYNKRKYGIVPQGI